MTSIQLITEHDKTVRTQITLTSTLKRLIEKQIGLKGESLSEYLRRAAIIRLILDQDEKEDLKTLADKVIGSVKLKDHPEWTSKNKLQKWVKNLRNEWK